MKDDQGDGGEAMTRSISPGDMFTVPARSPKGPKGPVHTYRREKDDPAPMFESTRIRVTHLSCSHDPKHEPYTFGTEPQWFRERGLEAS